MDNLVLRGRGYWCERTRWALEPVRFAAIDPRQTSPEYPTPTPTTQIIHPLRLIGLRAQHPADTDEQPDPSGEWGAAPASTADARGQRWAGGLSSDGDIRDAGVTLRPLRRRHACLRSPFAFRACSSPTCARMAKCVDDGEARPPAGLFFSARAKH